MSKRISCPLCQRKVEAPQHIGGLENTHGGAFSQAEYDLVHCRSCDVVRLDPLPTEGDLDILYRQTEQFSDDLYIDESRVASMLDYYGSCLDHRGLMPGPGEASLEVGAGFSWVSRAIKLRDESVITVAQDVTDECRDKCPWVDQYHVGVLDTLSPETSFRLVSLTHVIEHLRHPAAVLMELAGRLAPDGRILVTAPHRPVGWNPDDGLEAWLEYSYLHVPAHIAYLSRQWFEITASRSGLKLLHWDAGHEDGQAFEAVLGRDSEAGRGWFSRLFGKAGSE
ncbi:MAG: methyltransferase domain-containing protein [Wenzhouxiangellaceae bacterium]